MKNSTEKMWRTLVRVADNLPKGYSNPDKDEDGVYVVIPGWKSIDGNSSIFIHRQCIPPLIYKSMKPGKRYHVRCNTGVENDYELCFDGWEKN